MILLNCRKNAERSFHRQIGSSIRYMNLCATAKLSMIFVERWLKKQRTKYAAWQFELLQTSAERIRINPWCSKNFKRTRRSASFRNICPFQQTLSGIHDGCIYGRHVWRWQHPWQFRFFKKLRSFPALHANNFQLTFDSNFI